MGKRCSARGCSCKGAERPRTGDAALRAAITPDEEGAAVSGYMSSAVRVRRARHIACVRQVKARSACKRQDHRSSGKILAWDPPRVLEYEWNVAPVPEMPRGEHTICRYELTPQGDSTEVIVTVRRITRQTAGGFLPGLHAFLDRLEAQLDGCALPEWMQRFGELRAQYQWNGHASPPAE
jgi:hypothetical protein